MRLTLAEKIMSARERDAILDISDNYEDYGKIIRFSYLDLARLDRLLDEGHIDPDERQNNAPSTKEIREFLAAHPRFTAHGYAVSPHREDYRMTLEGVMLVPRPTQAELDAFQKRFKNADEMLIDVNSNISIGTAHQYVHQSRLNYVSLYCWYD